MNNSAVAALTVPFDTSFNGRVIQVTEALDPGDAVSNQVLALDRMFKNLGLNSVVLSKWHHQDVAHLRRNLEDFDVNEKDIVIFHFCGYSEYAGPWALEQYCTRVMFYHNITPHHFFPVGSSHYEFCRKGREQLKIIVPLFGFYWGASAYNLEELYAAGAKRENSLVVPIVVPTISTSEESAEQRSDGHWLFVGRIVSNKGQLDLIDLFAAARAVNPGIASKLTLVGRYDPDDSYFKKIIARIAKLKLGDVVELTSKIPDAEREQYFRTSQFYVSISEHEGFGVPLIEAPLRGLPVIALDRAAARETTGGQGLFDDKAALVEILKNLSTDKKKYKSLVEHQRSNAERFSEAAVENVIRKALSAILPKRNLYGTLSVVICTYNRIDYLKRCLDYLQYQSNSNFEVIVVNGPSDDGTREFLASYPNPLKVYENGTRNLSVSRNIGIDMAAGDIVAFIDDDAIPFDNWVDNILRAYNERPMTVVALGGPVFFAGTLRFQSEDIGIDRHARSRDWMQPHELGRNGWYRSNLGTNSTFVRAALEEHRGFDEQFDYFLDESELCLRLQLNGNLIGYSRDVIVRHEFAQSHNRKGKYNYDWKTICKNITYFVAAYSGLKGKSLRAYLDERLSLERVAPLRAAFEAGELTKDFYEQSIAAIWEGVVQGLRDVKSWPKTRAVIDRSPDFIPFDIDRSYRAIGRDVAKLHICVISKEAPPFARAGGVGTLYYHLVSELLLMGHDVSLIIPSHEDRDWKQGPLTVCYTQHHGERIPGIDEGFSNNLNWSLSAFARLARLHAERKVDVVDSALWDAEALAFSMVAKGNRPPLVLRLVTPFKVAAEMNHWTVPEQTADAFMAAESSLIANADAIIPISDKISKTIQSIHGVVSDSRWTMIPCGIAYWPLFDVNENYTELNIIGGTDKKDIADDKIILFVGRLELRKGVDTLFDALNPILTKSPAARIVIAGKDADNWEEKVMNSLPDALRPRVHFLGDISDALREKLMANAYCLIFPSRYESFGLVPLEAFVHKVPVIASNSGAIPEVVLDGDCGLLFQEGDSAELARTVTELLSDKNLHTRLSKGAERRIRTLSSRVSAVRTLDIYSKVCAA